MFLFRLFMSGVYYVLLWFVEPRYTTALLSNYQSKGNQKRDVSLVTGAVVARQQGQAAVVVLYAT